MAFSRPCPPPIQQTNQWWCWAACLEILNRAHPEKFQTPIRNQQEWVSALQAVDTGNIYLNPQGGINVQFLPVVLNELGMRGHTFGANRRPNNLNNHSALVTYQTNHQNNIAHIEQKLQISYLIGVYPVDGGSHFVIIYGIDANNLYFFNPWAHAGKQVVSHQRVESTPFIIAWKP